MSLRSTEETTPRATLNPIGLCPIRIARDNKVGDLLSGLDGFMQLTYLVSLSHGSLKLFDLDRTKICSPKRSEVSTSRAIRSRLIKNRLRVSSRNLATGIWTRSDTVVDGFGVHFLDFTFDQQLQSSVVEDYLAKQP